MIKTFFIFMIGLFLLTGCSAITAIYPTTTMTVVTYKDLSYFQNYTELSTWLDGIWDEYKEYRKPEYNCVDYSWWLIDRAMQDGYLMVFHPVTPEAYNNSFTRLELDGAHAITATYINKHTYLIEPQNLEIYPDWEIE